MIKQVIKRNGELQNFQPEKLNGWGIWSAAELGPKVDWISAVLHTASTAPEIISTRELQEILINYCLTKASWAYNRMAGRLYISLLYKELYDNKIPTIKQVFSNLTNAGIMTEEFFTAFSDQDYQDLEKIIDHSIDLKMTHYQIKQSIEKYSLKDRVDQIYYETPQFSNMRVAMRMCKNKGKGKARIDRIARHYNQYASDQTNVPTPYFTNSGTKTSGFLSCCLHQSTDTLGSLAAGDHISYMFTAASAGIGSKVVVRSAGDKVRGGTISHSGRINYLRSQVAAINANLQNGRGGAEAQYVDSIDKEVLNVIPMKNPMTAPAKQVRGLDYGFCFNAHFAKLAATNQPYYLFSFADAPELFNAMSSKDPNEFEKLYEIAIKKPLHRVKINARDLMFMVLEQSVEVGQMYMLNLSDCNIHTPFLCPISQSNLCLSGDSLVDIKIDDRAYKVSMFALNDLFTKTDNILVKSYDIETKQIVWKKVTNSALMNKNAKVMKITDESGKSIVCTPEHKVYTKNRGYVMAKDLSVDDELLLEFYTDRIKTSNIAIEYLDAPEAVYDITVEGTHCFFANDILVHNCVEIKLPTKPYKHITELYKTQYDEGDGEVAVCAIAGTSVGKFEIGKEDEQHKEAAWVALDMIHTAITETEYPFPQVKFTANQRRSAGVGIIDLAHDLARRGLKYSTLEGRNYIHKVAERHYWYLTEASLELSKEFGNAAWMDKTLWPKGWLPLDTYKKSIDDIVTEPLHYDWESRRQEIIDNGGHAFSVLVANMPAESSSIKSGTTNGPYPVRDKDLKKSNDQLTYSYVVPESDEYGDDYELAWDIDVEDMAKVYGVLQKWADQMTSADLWYKSQGEKISSHDLMRGQFALIKYGVPGRYYLNSLTGKNKSMSENKSIVQADTEYQPESTADCAGCKL